MKPIQKKFTGIECKIDEHSLKHPMTDIIMSYQEDLIMDLSAEKVCQNGGDILNVGYGLGVVDSYIKTYNINSHHIIEIHPQLYQNAIDNGYNDVYLGDWRDVIENFKYNNKKFDGIYFDTHDIGGLDEWWDFCNQVDSLLNSGGVYSYFNVTTKTKVEDMLTNVLGYTKFSQVIPITDIKCRFTEWVDGITLNKDYIMVWFIKP
jgi:tRNA A58 N-methylase Trm61